MIKLTNTRSFRCHKLLVALCLITSFSQISLAGTPMDKLREVSPSNWEKWGADDQVGTLNYLNKAQALRGQAAIKSGKTFTLQLPMTHGVGPVFPGRVPVMHFMSQDEGSYKAGKKTPLGGGMKYSDDAVFMYLQGTTHMDALGHAWYGDKVYNGKSADSSTHGHDSVDVGALGEKGIVGRGVLLDIGRFKGDKNHRLAANTCVTLVDLQNTAKKQKIEIKKRDILLIRTGSMGRYYDKNDKKNWGPATEPGLCYSAELVKWLDQQEIPMVASDNLAIEKVVQKIAGEDVVIPLHGLLIRDLGLVLSEIYWLDGLADDSAEDGQYSFMFTAAPLKMERGSGAPINPIVIK